MCFSYDGIADIYRTKPTTARKEHRCNECGHNISPGEQYLYHFQVYEGVAASLHVCRDCSHVRQLIHDAEIAAGCAFHESWPPWERLHETVTDGGYEDAAKWWGKPAPAEFVIIERDE